MQPLREPQDPAEALVLVRRYLQASYRIAEAALETLELGSLYAKVHAIVRDLMPAENLYFALWDKGTDTVSFPYFVDAVDPTPAPRRLRRGLTEYVLRTQEPLLLDDEVLASLEAAGEVTPIGAVSLHWLGVPLLGSQGVFGALVIQVYAGGRRYTQEESDLLVFVSGQVALAIERQRAEATHRMMTQAIDQTRDSVFGIDAEGHLVFVNAAACLELGYPREELLKLSLTDVDSQFPADQWPQFMATLRQQGTLFVETRHRRKDGSTLPVEISVCHLTHEGRELAFGYARDTTVRQAAEQALRASEDKFFKAFLASPDAININALDGTYLEVNEAFTRMSGWAREEALGSTTMELGLWANLADRARAMERLRLEGHFEGLEAEFRMKDGSIRTGLVSGVIIQVDHQPSLLSITRDISERKAAEQALGIAERRLRTVLAHSQAIIYQLDPEGRFTLSEGLGLADIGLSPGEVVGRSALELYAEDPAVVEQIHQAQGGKASRRTTQVTGRLFDNFLTPVFDETGNLESIIGIATDITQRHQAEAALLAERGLFVGGPVMVFKWRAQPGWPVDYVSPNVAAILGYAPEDLLSGALAYEQLIHPEDLPRIQAETRAYQGLQRMQFEQQYRLRTSQGTYRWFYDFTAAASPGAAPSHFLGYLLDITDRRQAEDTLRQTQKLESLGVLAGGIAHDFNNLLTVVLGNLSLAQLHLEETSPALPYLATMETSVLRAAELTKQMLAYSGRGHFVVRPLNLNAVVRDLIHLLEVSISKKVSLRFDLEPDLPTVQADVAQLQQVVMNLVTNASDAIGDQTGAIHVSTCAHHLQSLELQADYRVESPQPGLHVILEVEDTGCGMAPDVLERIFDPFFTTKATGRGLGLSAMLGILRGHGAGLQIASEVGRGSLFRLCFPASGEPAEKALPVLPGGPGGLLHGLVLLVDDEPQILKTTGSALAALGFEVVCAADGIEAVERFLELGANLRLVLMDLTMPRMDGLEAFQVMRDFNAAIPVVLSSGFTEQDSLKAFPGAGPAAFLPKPYRLKELRAALEGVLGHHPLENPPPQG